MTLRRTIFHLTIAFSIAADAFAQTELPTFEELKAAGAGQSNYRIRTTQTEPVVALTPNLTEFEGQIQPLLRQRCFQCHGAEKQEADFRIDTLDPDLIHGDDAAWWVEILDALSNDEMPPQDEVDLSAAGRSRIVDWLSSELQLASRVARSQQGHSSFRRMTRYEYNYALQDLLGLPYDFAEDLPPETVSEDGFLNSSEMLQMSAMQFETYRQIARQALLKATVRGAQPKPLHYAITMDAQLQKERKRFDLDLMKLKKRLANNPDRLQVEIAKRTTKKPRGAHYTNLESGVSVAARWQYRGASYAHTPTSIKPDVPPALPDVAVIPPNQKLIIDLGDHLPDSGILRLRIRASAVTQRDHLAAALRVFFGHQASNNSRADRRVGDTDIVITATPGDPKFYDLMIPLSEVVRNPFRGIQKLGQTPNPAEYLMLLNTSAMPANIQIDYIEITVPFFVAWPPETHRRIFVESDKEADETAYAHEVLARFMTRAWRRPPANAELDQKMALFEKIRPQCTDSQEAMIEVLAGVLSSPKFLYLVQADDADDFELATRLSMFLWSSIPDEQLMELATDGRLANPDVLSQQTERMLIDPRAQRFPRHFVRQWLGMQLLDHLDVEEELRAAMHDEPIAFFQELLRENHSVMEFLHADWTMVNARLASHYGLAEVFGHEFLRVELPPRFQRGGLLTQAGLLAMNSDGKDSHPLKRGIWLLESILNDPPPPPPPAVPEIDLSDPEILKLSLKERMEDHRNDPACISCHQRIDPWGIAFENFDALGRWRTSVRGKPVDANSILFNKQQLRGMDGLKRFLLNNRQDQFARAVTYKLTTYALGRPLSFADRAEVDRITAELRHQGDGLRTLIKLIVTSDLFSEK